MPLYGIGELRVDTEEGIREITSLPGALRQLINDNELANWTR